MVCSYWYICRAAVLEKLTGWVDKTPEGVGAQDEETALLSAIEFIQSSYPDWPRLGKATALHCFTTQILTKERFSAEWARTRSGNGYAADFELEIAWQPDQDLGTQVDREQDLGRRKRGPRQQGALPVESEKLPRFSGNSAGEERATGGCEDAEGDPGADQPTDADVKTWPEAAAGAAVAAAAPRAAAH